MVGTAATAVDVPIRVEEIRKSFGGVEVLHGVSLQAAAGSVTALLGENGAGKSTLVKIMSGDYAPDSGKVWVDGAAHDQLTPLAARTLGVRMIYQELNDAPSLSVAENISLGRLPSRRGLVKWREVTERARSVLEELGVDIDPRAPMSSLRVGERQIVEIARALTDDASVLILDEPTAALSNDEVSTLFSFVERLRGRGTAMVYITHRLDEVRQVADSVAVLRDGSLVLECSAADSTRAALVEAMVGQSVRDVDRPADTVDQARGAPLMTFTGASSGTAFTGIDLEVREGEVVGLYGKVGSGIAEVVETGFGLRRLDAGSAHILSGPPPGSPREAIRRGIGYLPADRKGHGAFLPLSAARNLVAPVWARDAGPLGWMGAGSEEAAFERWRTELGVKVSPTGGNRPVATLSGGNQQKVLLARWLHAQSRLLLLVEPTRGVDVGARQEIYSTLRALASSGAAVLFATSDYEEVVQLADRALVMSRGRIARHLGGDQITVQTLTDAAGG